MLGARTQQTAPSTDLAKDPTPCLYRKTVEVMPGSPPSSVGTVWRNLGRENQGELGDGLSEARLTPYITRACAIPEVDRIMRDSSKSHAERKMGVFDW